MNQSDDILKAIKELARRENDYKKALIELAEAEHAYRLKKNTEILKAEGSEKIRIAIAEIQAEKEMKRKLNAEASVAFLKDYILDCRQAISARQTILSADARTMAVTQNFN